MYVRERECLRACVSEGARLLAVFCLIHRKYRAEVLPFH